MLRFRRSVPEYSMRKMKKPGTWQGWEVKCVCSLVIFEAHVEINAKNQASRLRVKKTLVFSSIPPISQVCCATSSHWMTVQHRPLPWYSMKCATSVAISFVRNGFLFIFYLLEMGFLILEMGFLILEMGFLILEMGFLILEMGFL